MGFYEIEPNVTRCFFVCFRRYYVQEGINMSKVVIVTGASRGIGAATVIVLAAKGYKVCINYVRNSDKALALADAINKSGGQAIAVMADVSEQDQVVDLFDQCEQQLGPVDALVNNVGVLFTQSKLVDIDLKRFNKVLKTNVNSCFLCSQQAVKRMKNGGAIVNVSSLASKTGSPFEYVDYAASKGAMDVMTKGLAAEVASLGIRVNAVRPGAIETDIHSDGGEPNRIDRLKANIPMGRGGKPEEVANFIAWLLSDEASYVSGSILDIGGGR